MVVSEALKLPVKSISRAKAFYEGFLQEEVFINAKIGSKVARIITGEELEIIGYLYEKSEKFIPDTLFMIYEIKTYKDIRAQLKKIKLLGGKILFFSKQDIQNSYKALIRDSEGNRIIILFNNQSLSIAKSMN